MMGWMRGSRNRMGRRNRMRRPILIMWWWRRRRNRMWKISLYTLL
jgi:hypothetical protein